MEAYETLGMLGEGTYGVVVKARHRATARLVAIKKYKQAEDDDHVRKTSLREVRVLKQLRHPNVISLLDVFRRDGKLYLVFEYVEKTILQLIEERKYGLSPDEVRRYTFQLLNGVSYCHAHNIIHRDVKPENVLVSKSGVLKLCDFGFARQLSSRGKYTDYVATRWYRAPELLVGDVSYGRAVDIWAIGCIFSELSDGQPLFPGESDLDQLSLIMRTCGAVTPQMLDIFEHNTLYRRVSFPHVSVECTLEQRFPRAPACWLEFLSACLRMDPAERPSCVALMNFSYFTEGNFRAQYEAELRELFLQSQPTRLDVGERSATHQNPLKEQRPSQVSYEDGMDSSELTLPRINTHLHDTEKLDSTGPKGTTLWTSGELVGGAGGSTIANSNSTSFHQLGTLWSHYIGSTVGAVTTHGNELPAIGGGRQCHVPAPGPPPGVQGVKACPKVDSKLVGEKHCSGAQPVKASGRLRLSAKSNNSRSPDMQCLKASTILNGQKVKQIKTDVKSESKREWKSCTELGRSSQSHTYLIPLLSNGSNVPSPGPYTTIGTNLSVTSTLQDAGNHTVTKTPNRSSVNGSSCVDPQVGNAVVSCGSRDKKTGSDSGDQGSLDGTQKSMKKHARRLTGHGDPYNSVQGSPGGSGSYNVVTGSKCLLHDATTKR